MEAGSTELDQALRALVGEYRARCLWFLRPDWYPNTVAEQVRALDYIEQHGDAEAFRRARVLRRWLSRTERELALEPDPRAATSASPPTTKQ